ncbi:hypothetical protein ACOMHN_040152 [Nucella lapillus]
MTDMMQSIDMKQSFDMKTEVGSDGSAEAGNEFAEAGNGSAEAGNGSAEAGKGWLQSQNENRVVSFTRHFPAGDNVVSQQGSEGPFNSRGKTSNCHF